MRNKLAKIVTRIARTGFNPDKMRQILTDAIEHNEITKQQLNKIGIMLDNMGRVKYGVRPWDICTRCLTSVHSDCSGAIVLCRCPDCYPDAKAHHPNCCGQNMAITMIKNVRKFVCTKCKREVTLTPTS